MSLSDDITALSADIQRLNDILEGDENTDVTMADGGTKPSLTKAVYNKMLVWKSIDITMVTGGYINCFSGNVTSAASFKYCKVAISGGEAGIRVTGSISGAITALATYYDEDGVYISYQNIAPDGSTANYEDYVLTVPSNAREIGFSCNTTLSDPTFEVLSSGVLVELQEAVATLQGEIITPEYWEGKKIVWFGTSIPAGGGDNSYPNKVATLLGATVVNEAVSSSMARNGIAANVVAGTDPYGWSGLPWENAGWALSADITEKQYFIDNWETIRTTLTNTPPTTLDSTAQEFILDCSWENKLGRHLGDGNRADLYVFDHGHNDNLNSDIDTEPTESRDKGYFIGAIAYIIDQILADNPKARICFIGHYENARKEAISQAQEIIAEQWDFPLLRLWEKLGWSQETVLVDDVETTMTEVWMEDNLHPHSDTTGEATDLISEVIAAFIKTIR